MIRQGAVKISIAFGANTDLSRLEALYGLIHLVDDIALERSSTGIDFVEKNADEPDAPGWRTDVKRIIAQHFQNEIRQYMPDGRWQLRIA